MARRACDGAELLDTFRAAVANLEAHVDEINALNVYPVPDGDTGSNMLATVRAALEEAEGVAGQPAHRIATAISFGALMGAPTRFVAPTRTRPPSSIQCCAKPSSASWFRTRWLPNTREGR